MGYQLWLADAARRTGYPVVEVAGWQTRGESVFHPQGVMWHHTGGSSAGDMPSLGALINGRPDLPGPLSQYGLGRSGTIYVVAAGESNHTGEGVWRGMSGNDYFIGIEAQHTGSSSEPWPAAQLDAYRKLTCEILRELDRTEIYMCGHKEYALPVGRKIDPISLDMDAERANVAALLKRKDVRVFLPIRQSEAADRKSDVAYVARRMNRAFGLALPEDGTWGADMVAAVAKHINVTNNGGTRINGKDYEVLDWAYGRAVVAGTLYGLSEFTGHRHTGVLSGSVKV